MKPSGDRPDRTNAAGGTERAGATTGGPDRPLHPIAHVLQETYPADNYDTLGNDLTGLMIDLSRVPFDKGDQLPVGTTLPPPLPTPGPVHDNNVSGGRFRLSRLIALFRG